jgi:hypothetical protein
MSESWTTEAVEGRVRQAFAQSDISIDELSVRRYPEETIFVVTVQPHLFDEAAKVGNALDSELSVQDFNGFVTVRQAHTAPAHAARAIVGVHDERAVELVRILQARARTSEAQPGLVYVPDSAASITTVTAARHHVVFGRRGAGKTALLLEAKRVTENQGALTVWLNLQPYRWASGATTAGTVVKAVLDEIEVFYRDIQRPPQVFADAVELNQTISKSLSSQKDPNLRPLLPQVQRVLSRFSKTTGKRLFVFLDDYYFVPRADQAEVLDSLHACVRDADTWLKVATIRHLSRWFEPSRQVGLQLGHDADALDLDVTLQDPTRAKQFLETVLRKYAESAGINSVGRVLSASALDRLLLASGSVPRDYMVLASNAISKARERPNAKTVGVQDVNRSAGDAAQVKLQELEEDLSPNSDWSTKTRAALDLLLRYCLDETHWAYFRVDFRQKVTEHDSYDLLASLMDLRMIHLLNPSLSDERRAGEKSEVYMLDLSQYSGERLKKYLHVLDFANGHFVLKETGRKGTDRVGGTPKQLIAILRRAPTLDLAKFAG